MTPSLEKLWNLTGAHRDGYKDSENAYFDPIGLILLKDPVCWGYWCTPINTISFATTGGDGVHFGFLCEKNTPTENSPIVMTLPSADTSNIIIGENFKEFLSFGCRLGYFELEQIEYQPEVYIPFLDTNNYPEEMPAEEVEMLKVIEHEFKIKPIISHKARLAELKLKHLGSIQYSEEYYEITT